MLSCLETDYDSMTVTEETTYKTTKLADSLCIPSIAIRNLHIAVLPAVSIALYVILCCPHVNSLPLGLLVINAWTPTLSVTVTPGSHTLVHCFADVMSILSGHEEILGGSLSVWKKRASC